MSGLFQTGAYTFNSGVRSPIKLECDKLSDSEIETLALIGAHQVCHFGVIVPVPKGKSDSPIDNAKRLAEALAPYARSSCPTILIVDDVWTTGGSMEACRIDRHSSEHRCVVGWVAFAYQKPAPWVTAGLIVSPTVGLFRPPLNQR